MCLKNLHCVHCLDVLPGSVFSVSVSSSAELVCSGGEDDKAFVWRLSDGGVLFQCDGEWSWQPKTVGTFVVLSGNSTTSLYLCHYMQYLSPGHKDSVSCTGFSSDGKYVATADMGGLIQVWAVADGKRVWSFETGDLEVRDDFLHVSEQVNLSFSIKLSLSTNQGALYTT